jgi:hypothetical protein
MKKLFALGCAVLFTLGCAVYLSSCSKGKVKDVQYDLHVFGTASLQEGVSFDVDLHYSNIDESHVVGDEIARILKTHQHDNGIVEKEIAHLLKWKSYDITVCGFVQERITSLKLEIDRHFIYPLQMSVSKWITTSGRMAELIK